MANQPYIAPGGGTAYRKADGTGIEADPFLAWFKEDELRKAIGTTADAANGSGSLLARWGEFFNRVGLYGDAASSVGSINAKLRKIAESNTLPRANNAQYYASVDGGNVSYNSTAGVQSVNSSGGNVSALLNPSGSGVDLYIQRLVLSSDNAGRYERYRGATLSSLGTAATSNNRGGHPTNVALGKVYGQSAFIATGGTLSNVTYVGASNTSADAIDGSIILRPGQDLHWKYIPNSGAGTSNCAIEVVWWELPAKT